MHREMGDFRIAGAAMRYSAFVPRLYNWCLELGLVPERMMPSRAFCSDENQGYPTILLTKHFGTFPFNHGRVGGMVAMDRHATYAHHGSDLVIVQASHVGYDPRSGEFGTYRRLRTADRHATHSCGKLCAVIDWYAEEYRRARADVRVGVIDGVAAVTIDNRLLDRDRPEGLIPRLDRLIGDAGGEERPQPLRVFSTAKAFAPTDWLRHRLGAERLARPLSPIGAALGPDLFEFRRVPAPHPGIEDQLERNLFPAMRAIVTARWPALDAARYNTQIEFDRTYRSLQEVPELRGKNLVMVAGLNIDVSPVETLPFPLTKFVPWAACVRLADREMTILEQPQLVETLRRQPLDNPHQMALDDEIRAMSTADEIKLPDLG